MIEKTTLLLLTLLGPLLAFCQADTSKYSFYQVYDKVISPSCAIPACHDGSFEPDYRTPESTYYTLVYHPIIKNDNAHAFTFRVVPHKPDLSVLYQRISNCCFVNVNDRMPFTVGDTLSSEKIYLIKKWITDGAKDIYGNEHEKITAPVSIANGFNAYLLNGASISDNESRSNDRFLGKKHQPFIVHKQADSMKLVFYIADLDSSRLPSLLNPVIKIYDNINYSLSTANIDLKIHNNSLEALVPLTEFKKEHLYYFQVELFDKRAQYLVVHPTQQSLDMIKHTWSFFVSD